jgi:predicted 3-demethylubiquinone-9 3-methyltransferase (glyoxalase superfamily)
MKEASKMQKIVPYLWFDDQLEEAVNLYTSIFQNSRIDSITHFGDEVPGPKGKVMTASFQLAGTDFLALNGGPEFSFTPSISFFVSCQDEAEIDALWSRLSEGGQALMELGSYPFAEKFGWVSDRYGLTWQLILSRTPQKISPYLLFVGAQAGRAEEAMQFYTSLFENASILQVERYGKDMGEKEGNVMLARFFLEGQEFLSADSSLEHAFTFTSAISLFINCKDQAEVDYFWKRLSEGGAEGPCGWLTDRFGVSWQVIPIRLGELMSDPDPEKAGRVTQAMLKMSKIDVAQLERAYSEER